MGTVERASMSTLDLSWECSGARPVFRNYTKAIDGGREEKSKLF